MIKVIHSNDLKTDADLVCSSCGRDHSPVGSGYVLYEEGVDFVYEAETEDGDEWCICMECKLKFDSED